jgi:hypothetical protein
MKDFMAQFGARLVDNGYPVIPIMPGAKVPGHFRKGDQNLRDRHLAPLARLRGGHRLRCGGRHRH